MKIVIMVVAVLVSLVLLVAIIGWSLPVKHSVSRMATYAPPPEVVYGAITRVEDFPAWRSKVKTVDVLDTANGRRRFRESGGDGDILYEVEDAQPPRRLVTRIADDELPFGGRWTYELTPSGNGTTLRITEDGEVYNPIFRFMSKFVFGHHATLDSYLTDLGRKLGVVVVIT
jgi:uncharacterized protein YndB with AHSA1/START domain